MPEVKLINETAKKEPQKYKYLFVRLTPNGLNIDEAIEQIKLESDRVLGVRHHGTPDGKVGETKIHYHFVIELTKEITIDGYRRRLNKLGYSSGPMLNVKPYNPSDTISVGGYLFHEQDPSESDGGESPIVLNVGHDDKSIQSYKDHNQEVKTRAKSGKRNHPIWQTIQYFRDNSNYNPDIREIFTCYLQILRQRELPYPGKVRAIINIQTIRLHLCPDSDFSKYSSELFAQLKYDL